MRKYLLISMVLLGSFTTLDAAVPVYAAQSSSSDIVVQSVPGQTVTEKITARTKTTWPWYVTRGSGLVAAGALIILMISGIGQVTGYTYRFLDPLTSWASHRALGITFGISVLIHMFSLLFDKFIPFNILQIFVPWLSDYRRAVVFGQPVGSLWVALGVIAFYLTCLVIITSLFWVEKKPYLWKFIHLISYVIILLVFIHALYLGSDLAHGIWRWLWFAFGAVICGLTAHRLWRAKTV